MEPDKAEDKAFQCGADVFDLKIRDNQAICGLRNGSIEVWDLDTNSRVLKMEDQMGNVQVRRNIFGKKLLRSFII